jgi:hypothetical protein
MQFLEINIGEKLEDLGYGNDFWDTTPKTQTIKEVTGKLDFIEIKNVCSL